MTVLFASSFLLTFVLLYSVFLLFLRLGRGHELLSDLLRNQLGHRAWFPGGGALPHIAHHALEGLGAVPEGADAAVPVALIRGGLRLPLRPGGALLVAHARCRRARGRGRSVSAEASGRRKRGAEGAGKAAPRAAAAAAATATAAVTAAAAATAAAERFSAAPGFQLQAGTGSVGGGAGGGQETENAAEPGAGSRSHSLEQNLAAAACAAVSRRRLLWPPRTATAASSATVVRGLRVSGLKVGPDVGAARLPDRPGGCGRRRRRLVASARRFVRRDARGERS